MTCVCLIGSAAAEETSLPSTYKADIETALKATLKDPYSAVITIGDPAKHNCIAPSGVPFFAWAVPVEYNAKNAFGGYVGVTKMVYWFLPNQAVKVTDRLDACP